ncbi:hypothetical protein [Bacillus sp. REN3]|uniref:hypothetical protein n=1 Tax=Bacillus sp. REN3 TaxID=2802440 RepID=UPI001AEED091|nr:hypothetical protein [Bacillus sp. REN3]
MINTKATPRHLGSIKKYKKFYEKWDYWGYAYFDGSDYLFLTQYLTPIGGMSGYLILNQDGDAVPYSQAEKPYNYILQYNTIMSQAISDLYPQIKKDMAPYKERTALLTRHRKAFEVLSLEERESVDRIIKETNITLENPVLLQEIFDTLVDFQKKVEKEQGFFDFELLTEIKNTFNQNRVVMYSFGIREKSLVQDYETVINSLDKVSGQIPSNDLRKIKNLLIAAKQSNQTTLEKSLQQFEQDELGNEAVIDMQKLDESLEEKFELEGKIFFEEKMLGKLRNPQ